MENYQKLADAIVLQVVKDYRRYLRKLMKHPGNEDAIREIKGIDRFFRSAWYRELTKIDGEYLIKQLRAEYPDAKIP